MTSQITLGDLRNAYYQIISEDPDDAAFLLSVNKALERIIDGGEWVGCHVATAFVGANGYITLPAHMSSILGVCVNRWPVPVFSEFHQYFEFGPGLLDDTQPILGFLTQLPGGYPSVVNVTAGQSLHFRPAVPGDNGGGKTIRTFGEDTNNQELFDVTTGAPGITSSLAYPLTTMSTPINKFTGLQKSPTLGRLNVYGWDGVTETLLSVYQPNETRPSYTRYVTGTLNSQFTINVLCRLCHIPVVFDTDFVPVGNLSAWEHALRAVKLSTLEQISDSEDCWNICFGMLNKQHENRRGRARYPVTIAGPLSNATRIKCN